MSADAELQVAGRTVPVRHLDKIFYPSTGFTKGDLINYYVRISQVLLPHLRERALTLKRYPNGVEGKFFYEKKCPSHRPSWMKTRSVWSETNDDFIQFCVINDLPSLVWASNLADLELHTSLALSKNPDRPTVMVFDLDPGAPADIVQCSQVGLWLRAVLNGAGLRCLAKTSGSKGLQIYVPLNTPVTFEQTKEFAHTLAQALEREHPELVVSRMQKNLRKGKVLIDWSQNDNHKTTVCVYSLRAKERPTVSTPVTWEEVEQCVAEEDPETLVFETEDVLARVEENGDLFEPVLKLKQKLPKLQT
ncbi:MAG: ATP-dependent DNA ligase [Verrucomicrobiaceae bacterium]|nr:MAG: ATP-dependent DNA ligase [Verrucomicrobiaceae bacterium]